MQLQSDTYKDATEIEIMQEVLPFSDADVLELGCGRARWTRTIAERFPVKSVTATEVDKIQHEKNLQISDLPKVKFVYGGAEDIPLDDASVDIVIMLKSLHHVPINMMDKALSEIHRVLRPGGLAYISEPVYVGAFNDILRLFNDEKTVRQAAFAVLKQAVDKGDFKLEQEIFFQSKSKFGSFAEFEERFLFPSHSDHQIDQDLHEKVKLAVEPHLGPNGASFTNPHRVDLLRKL
ncbi:MAG TPA: class I SAM-dependent methyltransferase [Thiolapillus brandeum]|uniref:Class I SAM-dependent methyltransferase n=1 Tax=Thiolapillus brandeum TaxID=1076588 RepID=A0A831JQV0_9GAMM|nr:class I SAM-dependent methyltransferase [Thiolapillus brandeum]